MPRIARLFAILLLTVAPARAADGGFPLGLEKLHWFMSADEIRAISPFFAQLPAPSDADARVKLPGYRWQDCTFGIEFGFTGSRLDLIVLHQVDPSPACIAAVRAALAARFGDPAGFERDGVIDGDYPYKDGFVAKLNLYPPSRHAYSGLTVQFYLPPPPPPAPH